MANFSLGEAVLGTVMDLAGLRKGMGQAEGESRSLWSKIGGIGEKALGFFTGNVLTKAFDGLVGAVQSVGDTLLNEAPRVEQLRTSFDNLATSAGYSSDEMLSSLRDASKGMITDVSLMESFNKSMLLVGEGMADKLPKLLEIAQASAAATGEDVGFLLDSLVTGIGRGSPMILDNLGLTINLAEAYDSYAKTLGISADEMTKAQQQMALLNAVEASGDEFIRRLGDNAGGTAQTMAQFKTTIENLKMGLASGLLPALTSIATPLADLAIEHLPKLVPLFEDFGRVLGLFIDAVLGGADPLDSFTTALLMLNVPSGLVSTIDSIGNAIQGFATGVKDEGLYIGIENFFSALNIEPPEGLWTALNTIIDVFNGAQDAIGNLIGIVLPFINEHGPALTSAFIAVGAVLGGSALVAAIPGILAGIGGALAALTSPIALIVAGVALLGFAWSENWGNIQGITAGVIDALVGFWNGTLLPALQAIWTFLSVDMMPIWQALGDLLNTAVTLAITALAGIWEKTLLPALKSAGTWISDTFGPILEKFKGWLDDVTGGAEGISGAIGTVVGWIENLTAKLGSVKLPDWMTPGSPTPWEMGLRGIADALGEVSNAQMPQLSAGLGGLPAPTLAGAGAGGGVMVNLNLTGVTINDRRDLETLAWQLSSMIGEQLQARRV